MTDTTIPARSKRRGRRRKGETAPLRNFYLAPRFARRDEMQEYADDLARLGHGVWGNWIDNLFPESEDWLLMNPAITASIARDDLADIDRADIFVAFTEPPFNGDNRGGRHVELGYAIAKGKHVIVVGPRENVFHCLFGIEVFETWEAFLRSLQ